MVAHSPNVSGIREKIAAIEEAQLAISLEDKARLFAKSHQLIHKSRNRFNFLKRLDSMHEMLNESYKRFRETSGIHLRTSHAAEWMLDNYYIIQQSNRQIREDMPKEYYMQLPKIQSKIFEDAPRIYTFSILFLQSCQVQVDQDRLERFVRAYQDITPLTTGELWALPTMLRFGILLCLTSTANTITGVELPLELQKFVFGDIPYQWDDEAIVSSSILSLRAVSAIDWEIFVERVSKVDELLRQDPAGVYQGMDFDTRDRYRKVIEKLARGTGQTEEQIAREAIRLARKNIFHLRGTRKRDKVPRGDAIPQGGTSPSEIPREAHIGYFLVDEGLIQLEGHVGYLLPLAQRLRRSLLRYATFIYFGSNGLLSALILGLCLWLAHQAGGTLWHLLAFGVLGLIPASSIAIGLCNWLFTRLIPARVLPKMNFEQGIPLTCKTMVVVPCLLSDAGEVDTLLRQIELHFLSNQDPNLYFALLSDFVDAPNEHMPEDNALLRQAIEGVEALNHRYHDEHKPPATTYRTHCYDPFLLFHRPRKWNPSEECWMAWERKRGKLTEFNQLILGHSDGFSLKIGNLEAPKGVRYVITLDADTSLPRGCAHRLISTLAHPLNRAQLGPNGDILAGYSVLQPRIQIHPKAVNKSRLTQIYSSGSGLDPYTHAISDVYQDLFGEGLYVGKGIYDVAAFEGSLNERVPENALLSHDLFEGIHGRVGLVTDISLFEDFPSDFIVHMRRKHRWVRGDWQISPWLFPSVPHASGGNLKNDLSPIDKWKILDNLRRSLIPLTLLAMLVIGWLILPGLPVLWTIAGILTVGTPVLTNLLSRTTDRRKDKLQRQSNAIVLSIYQTLITLVAFPYDALILLDAILTTLFRMLVSRKRLLQWSTTAHTIILFGKQKKIFLVWSQMWAAVLLSIIVLVVIIAVRIGTLPVALPLLITWLVSPAIAQWVSQPIVAESPQISEAQIRQLHRLACRTWVFFEHYVSPEGNWLPPDHYQENPRGLVVHHTSPTNIGMLFLSTLAAHDMGYLGALNLSLRLIFALEAMEKLERHQGHFLNWYESNSLKSMHPRYISTVDSGNLASSLLVLIQGLEDVIRKPVIRWQLWQGYLDTLEVLGECIKEMGFGVSARSLQNQINQIGKTVLANKDNRGDWCELLAQLRNQEGIVLSQSLIALVEKASPKLESKKLASLRRFAERVSYHLENFQQELDVLTPWIELMQNPPSLFSSKDNALSIEASWQELNRTLHPHLPLDKIPEACKKGQDLLAKLRSQVEALDTGQPSDNDLEELVIQTLTWCEKLDKKIATGKLNVNALLIGFQEIRDNAKKFFDEMDFSFLFHLQRQVFHIGYNLDQEKLDDNFYDLLASEARLASYVAITKGDVPQSHWLHLARPITKINGTPALLSWAGTMFEYLMPHLMMENNQGTLLDQSCRAAVHQQISYGKENGIPWGISEAGFYHFDNQQNYQYRAFGVPGLGFKRGLEDDLVIAPYASILALTYDPQAVLHNIDELRNLESMGCYGFYESLDFTKTRLTADQMYQVVRSYYAHHQGMILVALTNFLRDRIIVRRFHTSPLVQSANLLLHEFLPRDIPIEKPHPDIAPVSHPLQIPVRLEPWHPTLYAPVPQVHVLSNGRFSTLITHNGGGYCIWKGKMLTRWRADTTLDCHGLWIYLKDQERGHIWSATHQPVAANPQNYQVTYHPYKATFQRQDHDITTNMEITVHPEDDLEIRRVILANHSDTPRQLSITSYGEVALAPQIDDRRHPAFNKLFIESEFIPAAKAVLFTRRPRASTEDRIYLAHALITDSEDGANLMCTCSRAEFLGRNGDPRSPRALNRIFDNSTSNITDLDPVLSMGTILELPPHQLVEIIFLTTVANSKEQALAQVQRYQTWAQIDRSFNKARAFSQQVLNDLDFSTDELEQAQGMLSLLHYPHQALRAPAETLSANNMGQPVLWKYAISGDYPVLMVRISNEEEINLILQLLKAHAYWRRYNIKIDLVFLNLGDTVYDQDLHNLIFRVIDKMGAEIWLNKRGGIFMLRDATLSSQERILLETVACLVLDGTQGSLQHQLSKPFKPSTVLPQFVATMSDHQLSTTPPLPRPENLLFDNGIGGFSSDGKEYMIYLNPGQWPPAPWINVIANPEFGFVISESGGGFTWARNSGENRLTPWRNDPLIDLPGEFFYLRDEETGHTWSPIPMPLRAQEPYLVRHGAGYTIFQHNSHGIKHQLRVYAIKDAPIKVMQLRLENTLSRPRRITVTCYAEWVLGQNRETMQQYVVPEFDTYHSAILARNAYNTEFSQSVTFLTSTREPTGLTTDRAEFLGLTGDLRDPAALRRVGLSGSVEVGTDPCAALQTLLWISPGETKEVTFLLGQGRDREEAIEFLSKYRDIKKLEGCWQTLNTFWNELLDRITVRTPDPAMDILLNRWLLYQTLSCRIWGRSALYQSSGAFGFRDQLQDVMALLDVEPDITREHLLESARYQFEAGDVLHWWHPPSGRGVRTRCSDDLLWLPYVTAQYVHQTDDVSILHKKINYIQGDPLEDDEHERYDHYQLGTTEGTLFEHCRRALEKGTTSGEHGLPLIGSHDWNDGLNRVGLEGKGESVWNAWFLHENLTRFADLCDRMDQRDRAAQYRQQASLLLQAIEENAWDGEWYLRAFYDDGTPLGSSENLEGRIDSLPQSWGVLTQAAETERAKRSMDAVFQQLVRPDERLILLFTPPFDKSERDPGYIRGYSPGIRENGGQYTHAALWVVWAFAELGDGDRAGELFHILNPIYNSDSPAKAQCYRVEPYVVAADVYGVPPYTGRGGWTWYTGSAGWMYRLGMESILGCQREGDKLRISPCIPRDWQGYEIIYRSGDTTYHIKVENPNHVNRGIQQLTVDGEKYPSNAITLQDDGDEHTVSAIMG